MNNLLIFCLTDHQCKDIKQLLEKYKGNIYLPVDFAEQSNTNRSEIEVLELPTQYNLFGIGEKSISNFKDVISDAKTAFFVRAMWSF